MLKNFFQSIIKRDNKSSFDRIQRSDSRTKDKQEKYTHIHKYRTANINIFLKKGTIHVVFTGTEKKLGIIAKGDPKLVSLL